ncbi:MAG TPA: SCP2 sterol-binding domain-containing protein [Acidimicrobiales bacterium]|nr:SCP2 sterol-binding domain-containing protein [Acidimicrobiales bacterium]
MPEPWSEEWVAALDTAARADQDLRAASAGRRVVIGQEVVDGARRTRWHLVLDDGDVAVRPGPAEAPDVTFSQDRAVAEAVARGEMAARTAFVLGHIRVGGDVAVLLDLAPALAGLGDVFAAVRAVAPSGGA